MDTFGTHDQALVILSILIAVAASYTALDLELAAAGLPLLHKPFGQDALAAAIASCLGTNGQIGGDVVPFRRAKGRSPA
jgi:NO-binding membrane sensor protein with MHYT domain